MLRLYQRIILVFCVILCIFFIRSVQADVLSTTPQTPLFQSPEWLALVHYRPLLTGGYKSTIDSEAFFLSSDGKINPESELKETISLFENPDPNLTAKKCLFPARYIYLKKNNQIVSSFPDCVTYEQFKADLNPAGITLLYTDAYMSNPSSLFGHTLVRIDIPEGKTQLVAHGMNYGAYVNENTAGILYALYGLTGGYYGGFTVKPYYQIINTYNNIENRDIWEYSLNLTPQELDFFIDHLWEMGHTQTRYYFFTKNCSYLLTEVLDAVRPDLKLADDFPLQTIPLDTVKAVNQRVNFIKEATYRPSRQKRISHQYEKMTHAQKKVLIHYLRAENESAIEALPLENRADVWETAYEFVQYQWVKQDISLKEYRHKSFQILRNRRLLETGSTAEKIKADNPILSHDSMRVSASIGSWRGKIFEELGWRAAYHALTEQPTGLLPGAEILFLDTVLRYHPQTQHIRLQQLDLVKITSLAPFNALFHPASYQIQTGLKRKWDAKTNREKLVYTLKGGSGLTFQIRPKTFIYGLVTSTAEYGGGFYRQPFGIALGGSGGVLYTGKKIQMQADIARDFSDNRMMNETKITTELNYALTQNWATGISYQFKNHKYHSENTLKWQIKRYF